MMRMGKVSDLFRFTWLCTVPILGLILGCDQPIYHSTPLPIEASGIELSARDADTTRYNWPIAADGMLSVAKPPPMAYLTSFDEVIHTSNIVAPPQELWRSPDLSESARDILHSLISPYPLEQTWDIELPAGDLNSPQAFDLTPDGETLGVLNGDRIVLYNASDGKETNRFSLPDDWSNTLATALRFAPTSEDDLSGGDLLVASNEKICLLDRENGQRIAEIEGPGDDIKKWLVSDDGSFMVMLTQSGRLYGGDAEIRSFGPLEGLKAQKDMAFDDVGLCADGVRLLVTANDQPRTYLQEGGRIVDFVDYSGTRFSQPPVICAGRRDDFWVAGGTAFYTRAVQGPNSNAEYGIDRTKENLVAMAPSRETGERTLIWRPMLMSTARFAADRSDESTIAVSQRMDGATSQWVLHDISFPNQVNSVGRVLSHKPSRLLSDRFSSRVVILDSERVRVGEWDPWRVRYFIGQQSFEPFLASKEFDEIDQVLTKLHSESYWSPQGSSSRLQGYLIYNMGLRWAQLAEAAAGGEQVSSGEGQSRLEDFEDWMESGSGWAKCVHAEFIYRRSYRAWYRQDGLPSKTAGQRHEKFTAKALSELGDLVKRKRPPAINLAAYIACRLQQTPSFEEVDHLCRKYVELYPRNPDLPRRLGHRFRPNRSGEFGDTASLLLHHARLIEPPWRGWLYVDTLGNLLPHLVKNAGDYGAIDAQVLHRGMEHYIAENGPINDGFYNLLAFVSSMRNLELKEKMIRYIVRSQAFLPRDYYVYTGQNVHSLLGNWRKYTVASEQPE